jgi:hypothetical protein
MQQYTQIKVSVAPPLAAAFKLACARAGVSMAFELSAFMSERSLQLTEESLRSQKRESLSTRGHRRRAVGLLIARLEDICAAEEAYMDRIPENLQNGTAFIAAEEAIEALNCAIDTLNEAF